METHWLLKRSTRVPADQLAPWPPVPPQLTGVQSVFCSSRVEPAAHVLQVKVVVSKLAQLGTPPCGREAEGEGSVKGRPAAAQSFRQKCSLRSFPNNRHTFTGFLPPRTSCQLLPHWIVGCPQ